MKDNTVPILGGYGNAGLAIARLLVSQTKVGIILLGIGSQIRPWIGNKENPAILGGQPGRGYLSNQAAISARTWLKLG